jgi:hypothetical protein
MTLLAPTCHLRWRLETCQKWGPALPAGGDRAPTQLFYYHKDWYPQRAVLFKWNDAVATLMRETPESTISDELLAAFDGESLAAPASTCMKDEASTLPRSSEVLVGSRLPYHALDYGMRTTCAIGQTRPPRVSLIESWKYARRVPLTAEEARMPRALRTCSSIFFDQF